MLNNDEPVTLDVKFGYCNFNGPPNPGPEGQVNDGPRSREINGSSDFSFKLNQSKGTCPNYPNTPNLLILNRQSHRRDFTLFCQFPVQTDMPHLFAPFIRPNGPNSYTPIQKITKCESHQRCNSLCRFFPISLEWHTNQKKSLQNRRSKKLLWIERIQITAKVALVLSKSCPIPMFYGWWKDGPVRPIIWSAGRRPQGGYSVQVEIIPQDETNWHHNAVPFFQSEILSKSKRLLPSFPIRSSPP
jgi:hypothetical protein